MKYFTAAAIPAMMASTAASAQVYGGEDDPYQQNPYASNSYVPPPQEPAAPATAAPATAAPAATTPTDSSKTQQAAASGSDQDAKTKTQP
jgi:hypothetical protein